MPMTIKKLPPAARTRRQAARTACRIDMIQGSGPFPCTILAINAAGDIGEMPGPG